VLHGVSPFGFDYDFIIASRVGNSIPSGTS
jgi:hypothetical protein